MTRDNVHTLYAYLIQCEKCDGTTFWMELDGPEYGEGPDPDLMRVICSECRNVIFDFTGEDKSDAV